MELANLTYKEDLNNGATGPAGVDGIDGATGPTGRLFRSSNRIIIDSS